MRRHLPILALALLTVPALTAAPPAAPSPARSTVTAAQRLAATLNLYRAAQTYRDEASIIIESTIASEKVIQSMSFSTAFERNGRFRWACRGGEGDLAQSYMKFAMWSTDGKSFDYHGDSVRYLYDLVDDTPQHSAALDKPVVEAARRSAGCVTAILPLLSIDATLTPSWSLTTGLVNPQDQGTETIDDVACAKITGTQPSGNAAVTLWISDDGLIRQLSRQVVLDPSQHPTGTIMDHPAPIPLFTDRTTITFKPFINEPKIDDARFAAPKPAPQPALNR